MIATRRGWTSLLLALCVAAPAAAQRPDPSFAGHYYLNGVMETGSELLLKPDGRFEWMMVYGALDQAASGKWHRAGDRVILQTDAATSAPKFRPFTTEEFAHHPPAAPGGWTVAVGVPDRGPLAGVEVRFEGADGRQDSRVTGDDGLATLSASGRPWKRVALRRKAGDAWQTFELPAAWAAERFAAYFVEGASAGGQPPFDTLRLRIDGKALVPAWPWEGGKEQGRYERE